MSHGQQNRPFTSKSTPDPVPSPPQPTIQLDQVFNEELAVKHREVEWYRQCPHCWDLKGGVGTCQNTVPPSQDDNMIGRRYYKCDTCGMGFSREFEVATLVVEKRVVNIIRR